MISEDAYSRLETGSVVFGLPDHRVVRLTGADVSSWLQGQVTQDVRLLRENHPVAFCLCTPTGQLLGWGDLHMMGSAFLAIMDRAGAEALLDRVRTNVILEEVNAELVEGQLFSVQGPEAQALPGQLLSFPSDRTGRGGFDCLLGNGEMPVIESAALLDLASLENGVPVPGVDTHAKTLPPELGPDFDARTTSYSKGCYTGQEVLHRIYSRGHTNKTWVGLELEAPAAQGAKVTDGPGGAEVGVVSRSGDSPKLGPIAAATVRNTVAEPGARVWVEGKPAIVRAMPLRARS